MSYSTRNKTFWEKVKTIFISLLILVCFFFGIFTSRIFPGTDFAMIIDNTVGKFFNFVDFFTENYIILIETATIIIFVWLVYKVLKIVMSLLTRIRTRSATVVNLMMNALKYAALITGFFKILSAWGVETPTLLASAGIIAIAVSFGAQSLIEDIFAGIFIIFENQFAVGDIIQLDDFRGVVKAVGIRITKFEDINGDIKIINNSDIRGAINSSNLLSQAISYIDISYNQDIDKFEKMMRENIGSMREDIPMIKKGPFYDGIEKFQDSGITVRVVSWVNEIDRPRVIREMNKYLKILFDKKKIEIPFPQVVVHNPSKLKSQAAKKTTSSAASTKSTTAKKTTASKTTTSKPTATKKTTAEPKTTKTTRTAKAST